VQAILMPATSLQRNIIMQTLRSKSRVLTSCFLAGLLSLSISAFAQYESIRFQNRSLWNIRNLYVSDIGSSSWGQDVLGRGILSSGSDFLYYRMNPGHYDLKLVDQDGDVCILRNVAVFDDRVFTFNSRTLLDCEGRS
jgi:hypothetical protein